MQYAGWKGHIQTLPECYPQDYNVKNIVNSTTIIFSDDQIVPIEKQLATWSNQEH